MPMTRPSLRNPRHRLLLAGAFLLLALPLLLSCSTLGYYGQAAWGQTRILLARRDIDRLAADPETSEELKAKLAAVREIREFAAGELGLPDNGSFRTYVELPPAAAGGRRRQVVWNVVAAPELDTSPLVWCFPVAGCVSYRGYFSERRAQRFAAGLKRQGYDVDVAGAAAYSTLGWFKDPVLSTVIDYPEVHLAGLLFHELAHALVYIQDDSRFNESFATVVEIEGVRRWIAASGREAAEMERYLAAERREKEFVELLLATRDRLQEMYRGDETVDRKRQRKRQIFAELEAAYREIRDSWGNGGERYYDGWFEDPPSNARLVSVGTYHDLVPAFETLLDRQGGDLPAFYRAVRELAALAAEERKARLAAAEASRPGSAGEDRIPSEEEDSR